MSDWRSEVEAGLITALPMLIGFIPLGLILGAQASHAGISPLTTVMMTGLNFAGGSEFAVVALWDAFPPFLVIAITTALINSRHIIMGATLAPYLKGQSHLRVAFIYFLMCDETWALNLQEISRRQAEGKPPFRPLFYFSVALALYMTWQLSSFTGALLTHLLGDLSVWGFNLACPATFIALSIAMFPKQRTLYRVLPVVTAAIVAALVSVTLSEAAAVGLGSLSGLLVAFFTYGKFSAEEKKTAT